MATKNKEPFPNEAFRVPPQDLEAEQSVLGALMLSKDMIFPVLAILKEGDFYREANRKLFKAIIELDSKRTEIDIITLSDQLKKMGEFETIGGVSALTNLLERVPTAANAEYYAYIVKEKAKMRRIIEICGKAMAEAYSDTMNPLELQDYLVDEFLKEEGSKSILDPVSFATKIFEESIKPKRLDYIETGYKETDSKIKGMRLGALGTITGPFENGKSSFLQNVSVNVAKKFLKDYQSDYKKTKAGEPFPIQFKVLHLAFEDTAKNIMQRQICLMNGWPIDNLKSNDPLVQDMGVKISGYGNWANLGIRMGDKRNVGKQWKDIKLFILREIKQNNVKVVFIEGAERIHCQPIYGEDKWAAQDRMIDEMDDICQEQNISIWAIVGQAKANKDKGAPKNEMEGGSNAWAKISRQRLFVERHPRHENDEALKNISIVKITKNSDGHKGQIWFQGDRDSYKWKEFERSADETAAN